MLKESRTKRGLCHRARVIQHCKIIEQAKRVIFTGIYTSLKNLDLSLRYRTKYFNFVTMLSVFNIVLWLTRNAYGVDLF